jgi:hypothetical protein
MNAYATYTTSKSTLNNRAVIKVVLNVESDQGWLGACVMHALTASQAQDMAYNEADRRATAHGLTLQSLRPE